MNRFLDGVEYALLEGGFNKDGMYVMMKVFEKIQSDISLLNHCEEENVAKITEVMEEIEKIKSKISEKGEDNE